MMYIVQLVIILICAAGWFFNKLAVKILLCFMKEKNYTLPTDAELKACSHKVVCETHKGRETKKERKEK